MTEEDNITSYNCPECGIDNQWQIQNRICSAAAFFNPQITHVECSNCGYVDVADTEPNGENND